MQHFKMESSQIHSIGYDPVEQVMEARFNCRHCGPGAPHPNCQHCHGTGHTGTYSYAGVPVEAYAAVRDAKQQGGSVGSAFHQHIKKAGFKFEFRHHGAERAQ